MRAPYKYGHYRPLQQNQSKRDSLSQTEPAFAAYLYQAKRVADKMMQQSSRIGIIYIASNDATVQQACSSRHGPAVFEGIQHGSATFGSSSADQQFVSWMMEAA
eukprot:1158080-Pelagomonas_calceolata.AAC.3